MADLKISQLSAVSEVQGTDVFPTVSGLATMKASAAQIKTYVTESLDVNDSAVAGSYVTAVSEADGVISVTREVADVKPTANSTKMLTSGGAKAALDEKQNTLTFDNTPTANSNNPVRSGGVYTEVNSLKETFANNGAHNLNGTKYWLKPLLEANGITFSYNSDGTITANGTNNGTSSSDYISGDNTVVFTLPFDAQVVLRCETIGIDNSYVYAFPYCATDSERPYTDSTKTSRMSGTQNSYGNIEWSFWMEKDKQYKIICRVDKGFATTLNNIVFKPLLRLASDTDTTYTPYAKTNQQLTQETTGLISNEFANGAVNMLENKATSQVINGVTFTVNADGSVTVSTGSGGATADTNFLLNPNTQTWVTPDYPYGNYILSGCPSGGSASTYRLALLRQGATSVFDSGSGANFTHSSGITSLALIQVYSGAVITTPITFKPMITVADMPNSDYAHYVPYAKSNKELTDAVENAYIRKGAAINLTYTPSGTETMRNRIAGAFSLLQQLQATLNSDERFNITNLSIGSISLQSITSESLYSSNSTISMDFQSVITGSEMTIRSIHLEATSSNLTYVKAVVNPSTSNIIVTNDIEGLGTAAITIRVMKYKTI